MIATCYTLNKTSATTTTATNTKARMARHKTPTLCGDGSRLSRRIADNQSPSNSSSSSSKYSSVPPQTQLIKSETSRQMAWTDSSNELNLASGPGETNLEHKSRFSRSTTNRLFRMRDFGTGLLDDKVFEYRTRVTHVRLSYVQKVTKSIRVDEVKRVTYNEHGVSCLVKLTGLNPKHGLLRKVEHFDLWFFENGPEAMMQFVETTPEGASLDQHWRFRPFLGSLRSYLNGDFQVVASSKVLRQFEVARTCPEE